MSRYSDLVLADRPVGYWRLNETSGTTAADSSGNALNGTYTGTYTLLQSSLLVDDPDAALSVAGAGYVEVADSPLLSPQAGAAGTITLEAWVKPTSIAASHILTKGGTGWEWSFYMDASGYFNGILWNSGGGEILHPIGNGVPPAAAGGVYHVIVTFDRAKGTAGGQVWVNGVLAGTTSAFGSSSGVSSDTTNVVQIGRRSDGSVPWNGVLDEVAVYPYVLPPHRIIAHYTEGRIKGYEDEVFASLPLSMWRLNDTPNGASATYKDRFGLHNGTAGGSPQYPGASAYNLLPSDTFGRALDLSVNTNPIVNFGGWNMGTDDFAVECWFRPSGAVRSVILAQGTSYGSNTRYGLLMASDGTAGWNVGVNGVGNVAALTAAGALSVGSVYHLVGERSGTNVNLYINGVLRAQNTGAGAGTTFGGGSQIHYIGYDGTNSPGGHIQELTVYTAALGAAAVRRHYAARLIPPLRSRLFA